MASRKPPARPAGAGTPRPKPSGKAAEAQNARARLAAQQAAARERRRRLILLVVVGAVVLAVAITLAVVLIHPGRDADGTTQPPKAGPAGPEGIALQQGTPLAPHGNLTGQPVDGVGCDPNEQVVYHIHTHLAIFVNGKLAPVPGGIGMLAPVSRAAASGDVWSATQCYYWLHTHVQDGIIHIEAPSETKYTLGNFFALWGQPLSPSQVGPATGTLTVYVNGKPFSGDPATIQLNERDDIQLDVGSPVVAPASVDWSKSQL